MPLILQASPSSLRLQTLDYRVRQTGGARHRVKAKRSYANYLLPYKAMNWSKPRTSVIDAGDLAQAATAPASASPAKEGSEKKEEEDDGMDACVFRPGKVPPCRQVIIHILYYP